MTTDLNISTEASAILWVDDEPQVCKWFARCLGNEFKVFTADGVNQAVEVLREHAHEIALVVTDFRMPQRDGVALLRLLQRDYPHMVGLLATAYAQREVAIAAINEGQVFRILEKPLDEGATRTALQEAQALYRQRVRALALQQNYAAALRETLGFVAHELGTPLATVRGYTEMLRSRLSVDGAETELNAVRLSQTRPGQVAAALNAVERSAVHCQSLMSTFVQSARDAYPGAAPQTVSAASLVQSLLDEYPFEADERAVVSSCVVRDFMLPGRRDLLYLVYADEECFAFPAQQAGRPALGARRARCHPRGRAPMDQV